MLKKLFPGFVVLALVHVSYAQMPGGGMRSFKGAKFKVGHFYGKVIDSATGKAIPFAAIQISGPQWDSVSHTLKTVPLEGQLTKDNGEFSFEKLPVTGQFTIQINALGYRNYSKTVSFDLSALMKNGKKIQSLNSDNADPSAMQSLINAVDKDLGNIKVAPNATQIKAVTINGGTPAMELKLDKRVFDVSKSLTTTGGTAEDVLKAIPDVNVDIDGNVTLRNTSPTIYVDGLPTTLTIDQIPSDEIDKIEVITNPSAKYDASAGSGGIINIILKHNMAIGYNGSVRAGVDEYGKLNTGFDFNIRQGKFNVFANLHYHQVKHIMYGSETKDTVAHQAPSEPYLSDTQKDTNTMNGYFGFVRAGFDYFIDNRNTITFTGTYGTGNFNTVDLLHTNTDTTRYAIGNEPISNTYENSNSNRVFNNEGLSVLYKHLYPKEDENITASITANQGTSSGNGTFDIYNYNNDFTPISNVEQQQLTNGTNYYYVGKMDYTDPITKEIELDCGLMATINNVTSNNSILIDGETYNAESTDYTFNEQIYAAYFTFNQELTSRLSYQVALRMEQSIYDGLQTDTTSLHKLNNQNLLKAFPGGFITYKLSEKSNLQLSYTTHITRPSFNQLVVDNYSNPSNIQLANPNLKPAYQNSFELNYLNNFDRRNSLIFSVYYKITYDIIATQFDSISTHNRLEQDEYVSTYKNANYGYSEGAEVTSQNSPTDWLDVTANFNLFESGINATNLNVPDTAKPYLSYFAKLNLTFKLPYNFSIQLNGSYQSETEISPNAGGGGGGRWGGGYGGGITPSTSGYIIPTYTLDGALKKEFLKNNKASITFNIRDVFATAVNGTDVTATDPEGEPLYYETTLRRRDPRYYSINFSYRFGQTDMSLFKRKNNNIEAPPDMGEGDTGGNNN